MSTVTTTLRIPPAADLSPTAWAVDAALVGRSLKRSVRNLDALILAIALPVALMALFTYVLGGAISGGQAEQYVAYIVPGIILLCATFGAETTAVDVATDLTNGVIDRLRTMPLRPSAVLTGHVVAGLARNLLATVVVFTVAFAMGFRSHASFAAWLGAAGLVVLFILAITWLFAAFGTAARSVQAANGYGFAVLFLPYLSSAFVPVDTMPTWLQWVAENQPMTPIIETLRGLLTGSELGTYPLWAIGWTLAILLGSYAWARTAFRRKAGRK